MGITSLNGLLKRCQEIAREQSVVLFDDLPHANALGLGWYPGRMIMQQETEGRLRDCLPDLVGIIAPYYINATTLSHVVICEVEQGKRLSRKKRATIAAKAKNKSRLKGIFGLSRLRSEKRTIHVCQSELAVARLDNAICMSVPDRDLARMVAASAAKVNLVGENRDWYDEFMALAKGGCELTINGNPVVEYYLDEVQKHVFDRVGTSALGTRLQDILKLLMPTEARDLLAKLETTVKFDFSKLLPGDLRLFRNEKEFYKICGDVLCERYRPEIIDGALVLWRKDDDGLQLPLEPALFGHLVSSDLGCLDMLEWAQRDLKSVPHFYMYHNERLEPRYAVSLRIAQAAFSVMMHRAVNGGSR